MRRWGRRSSADDEWTLLPYLSHPVIGTVPLHEVGGKVPLQERDLPAWFTDLPEEKQEECYSAWLDRVADVLDGCGATRLEVNLYSFDVRAARDLRFDVEAQSVTEAWSQDAWRRVFSRLNPEALRVSGPGGDLVLMFETLDGMTVSAEVARALGAAP